MNCQELKSAIVQWVQEEVECDDRGQDRYALTLPLLKPNGDAIEVAVDGSDGQSWRISDLGETYSTLFLGGVDLYEEYVRAEEFRQIKELHGITDWEQELSIEAPASELASAIFDFVHAIQSILSLQLTVVAKPPKRDFPIVVAKFLGEHHASFEIPPDYIEGKTGRWKFDFVLNATKKETLVKTLTCASVGHALRSSEQAVFEILDVKGVRDSLAVVVADDEGARKAYWQPKVVRIFEGYQIPMYAFLKDQRDLAQLALRYAR